MQDMMMSGILMTAMDVMSLLFISFIGIVVLVIAVVFVIDISQTRHAIRRNYPVIGRFRYLFEHLGEFFRQYFFAMDREELPFNRALRTWIYRAAKNLSNTRAFGSTRDLSEPGSVIFVNCTFPKLEQDAVMPQSLVIGPDCKQPYETDSLVNISGMSYGALSRPAVLALSRGAYGAGCWMNTGEGGLSPWHLEGGADLVFQIGTAKYGVRDQAGRLDDEKLRKVAAHPQVRMFEIKLSQGAKPGKGGILPAVKVTEEIALIRGIPPFKDSVSPNRHPDISSVEDLIDMIQRVRRVTGKPTGFKLVLGGCAHLDLLLQLIVKRGLTSAPDFITVDGAEGGSGAAPMPLMDNVGMPLHESLPMLVDKLNEYGLRERIRVIASGKLVTPGSVAWALCVGADFVTSARGFLFALGCIQAMQCNRNTCPTGITTHNPRLQKGLNPNDKAERVKNYVHNLLHEVGLIAHSCGVGEPRELSRQHARIISSEGPSVPMNKLYPEVKPPLAD